MTPGKPSLDGAPDTRPDLVSDRFVTLRVDEIELDPNNPRDRYENIADLADSIDDDGTTIQVITVRRAGNRWRLIDGGRRLHALKRKGVEHVAVQVRDRDDAGALRDALVAGTQGMPLNPIEQAHAIEDLMRTDKLSVDEVGAKVGKTGQWVRMRLRLIRELDDDDQAAVRNGTLTATRALAELDRTRREQNAEAAARFGVPPGPRRGSARRSGGAAFFGPQHHLAMEARRFCRSQRHGARNALDGGVACGPCWESVIRFDESRRPVTPAGKVAAARAALGGKP